jgi:hypothetical protein
MSAICWRSDSGTVRRDDEEEEAEVLVGAGAYMTGY